MRKNLRLLFCMAALGVAFGPALTSVAQQVLPKVGGYKEVATNGAYVVGAGRFAVKAQAQKQKTSMKLLSIHKAERATVQGALYQLCMVVEIEDRENNVVVDQGVKVVVYHDLKGQYFLRSWKEENCNEEDDEEQ